MSDDDNPQSNVKKPQNGDTIQTKLKLYGVANSYLYDEQYQNIIKEITMIDLASPEKSYAEILGNIEYENYAKSLVDALIKNDEYMYNPIETAKKLHAKVTKNTLVNSGKLPMPLDTPLHTAIISTLICGKRAVHSSERLCKCLVYDRRAVAACVFITYLLFCFSHESDSYELILAIIGDAKNLAKQYISKEEQNEFLLYAEMSLEGIKLSENSHHIYKSMAVAAWSAREINRGMIIADRSDKKLNFCALYTKIIKDIKSAGGTKMHICVASATLGSIIGINNTCENYKEKITIIDQLLSAETPADS